ncbi:MAG: Class III cytochrome C family protein [Planctomycetes bacterium ADurb.Bin126]|nr:MAG: Class III cytochrome C family protein [Planctomycetes bacterium ADurb.Bin126]HOD82115.1 cytochrome c3 family protein [Phycisphaerae bacterium]HQL74343.1 cytochrome c3 family protein [Phycisphaerae bacterium]
MSAKVRRFQGAEIVFHWAQALPILALLVTGGMLLVRRALGLHGPAQAALAWWHKAFAGGLGLVACLALTLSLAADNWRPLWRTLGECLRWRPADFVWLLKAPVKLIWPRLPMPPAGRFNPGQKLNLLLQALLLIGFLVTGVWMMAVRGALLPWILHAGLFAAACLLVLVHLFLALVNPFTRRALPAMLTGQVSQEYAADHHGLTQGKTQPDRSPMVSRLALAATLAAAGGLAAWGVHAVGTGELRHRLSRIVAGGGSDLLTPGPLCASHEQAVGEGGCLACHSLTQRPSSASCLACHQEISLAMRERRGYHGRLEGECRTCHGDHRGREADIRPLDERTFNHALARFDLDGPHRRLDCRQCHLRQDGPAGAKTRYIGTRYGACRQCHANPHGDARADDCLRCHTPSAWKGRLAFDHDRDSRFRLDGRHADLACRACHATGRASAATGGLTTAPPRGSSSSDPATRAGSLAEFRLFGLAATCADCHQDPHAGKLGADCRTCHSEAGWKQRELKFVHNRDSGFVLWGAHATLACEKCHRPAPGRTLAGATLRGLGRRCDQCHKDPHAGQFKTTCDGCHNQDAWKGRLLVDPHGAGATFRLAGKHAALQCRQCHVPAAEGAPLASARFADLGGRCQDCHEDPHRGGMSSSACQTCHRETTWKGKDLLFAHDRHSQFRIDPLHRGVSCDGCHSSGESATYRGLDETCEGCHSDVVAAMAGGAAAGSDRARPDPHSGRVRCVQCHEPSKTGQAQADFARACASCHGARYERLFFDWCVSLAERRAQATAKLAQWPADSPARKELQQKLRQAARLHFHNLRAAVGLYDEVQAAGGPAPR